MHHRHCFDSSFHRSGKGSERRAVEVSTDINCLPYPLLAAHNCDWSIFIQFLPFFWAHTQNTMMMKTARGALTADRSFTQAPSTFCALLIKLDSRKGIGKKGVSCVAETKEQLLQLLWAFSMLPWGAQRISYTFLIAAGFLHYWTQRGFPSCFDQYF